MFVPQGLHHIDTVTINCGMVISSGLLTSWCPSFPGGGSWLVSGGEEVAGCCDEAWVGACVVAVIELVLSISSVA